MPKLIGRALLRREDRPLLTGKGQYAGDLTLPELLQKLKGLIRFQVSQPTAVLRDRLAGLSDAILKEEANNRFALECCDVTGMLLHLIGLLKDLQIELTSIEIIEPDLERVFLHLTGKTLRD